MFENAMILEHKFFWANFHHLVDSGFFLGWIFTMWQPRKKAW
jgi:hypothetical protein